MAPRYSKLVFVYGALLVLLAITVGSSQFHLGLLNPAINLAVAFAKASLIFWFFMELRDAQGLVRVFAVAAACWLMLLFVLGGSDWLTR